MLSIVVIADAEGPYSSISTIHSSDTLVAVPRGNYYCSRKAVAWPGNNFVSCWDRCCLTLVGCVDCNILIINYKV